jgi:hypothetical protein
LILEALVVCVDEQGARGLSSNTFWVSHVLTFLLLLGGGSRKWSRIGILQASTVPRSLICTLPRAHTLPAHLPAHPTRSHLPAHPTHMYSHLPTCCRQQRQLERACGRLAALATCAPTHTRAYAGSAIAHRRGRGSAHRLSSECDGRTCGGRDCQRSCSRAP